MAASYPSSVKSFTTKVDGVDDVLAAHVNDLQDEVAAIETQVGVNPKTIDDTVAPGASPASVAVYLDMLANIVKTITGAANWYSAAVAIAGIPAGSILAYGGASAPSGYLLCDGSAISRTTYATLFSAISTAYGVGDGSTTFNLPDLRRRAPVGKASADTLGDSDGVAVGSRTLTHTHTGPSHTHNQNVGSTHSLRDPGTHIHATAASGAAMTTDPGAGTGTPYEVQTGVQAGGTGATGTANEGYQIANYIIKT